MARGYARRISSRHASFGLSKFSCASCASIFFEHRRSYVKLNFRDILVRNGLHAVKSFPSGIGIESAGVIDALGPGVAHLAVGQRVACVAGPDCAYAEARLAPAARVVPLPADIPERTAAAMMIRGMTARYLLHDTYAVKPGDSILIHAAAGGVGLIVCQWAKHLGATVIGTVGNRDKAAIARAHGCDHPIVYGRKRQDQDRDQPHLCVAGRAPGAPRRRGEADYGIKCLDPVGVTTDG